MSRHKVSRGNTSDLIGMFNKKSQIEAPSSGDVGGLLSVNPGSLGVSHKFRKTSAFVPSTTKIEDKVKGQGLCFDRHILWQYGLWSFQTGGTKLERFLPKNQHPQRKLLNFENWINGGLRSFQKSDF